MSLSEEFLANGIVKIEVEDKKALELVRNILILEGNDGNKTHEFTKPEELNNFRLGRISELNSYPFTKSSYYSLAKSALHELVGNELVMQRNINLSIQLPGDDSSILPIHADSLQGDSNFEVVLWVPLVDCHGTKSMFFCEKKVSDEAKARLDDFKTVDDLYKHLEPNLKFMDVQYGEALIFHQGIFHGNVVNETNETRWSLNCRFKSLFSPYSDKKLGEFFDPIELRPVTKMGLVYER